MTSLRELKSAVSSVAGGGGGGSRRRLPNPTRRNQFGETPLHTAAIAGNVSLVERLIEQERAPLNPKDNCGWTPLHEACNHGHLEVVEALLRAGATVDPVDERSELLTPLHDACENGHLGIARLLLRYGADVCARNGKGETPVERLMNRRIKGSSGGGGGDQLSKEELADSVHLEREMLARMAEKGFSLDSLRKKIAGGGGSSSKGASDETSSKKRPVRNLTGGDIYDERESLDATKEVDAGEADIDEPGRGRLEYLTAIETVGRRPGKGVMPARLAKLAARKNRTKEVSALIAAEEEAPRDDWLIDDLGIFSNAKKRGSREGHRSHQNAYTSSPKKRRRYSDSERERSSPPKTNDKENEDEDAFNVSSDEEHSVREDFNCNYVNNYEEDNELLPDSQEGELNTDDGDQLTTTIELASSPLNSVLEEGEEKGRKAECSSALADPLPSLPAAAAAVATTNDNNFSKIIIVQFDDAERSSFAIPLPATLSSSSSTSLTFEWLSAELCKRYYRKFSVKPVISLYTTEGAIISAEDLVVDMIRGIGGGKPVFKARIESYSTEDPAKRFRELCKEAGEVEVCEELAETLSSLRVSGCFNVADSFLGAVRQNQLMLQSLYRQEIKEINVSFSNLLLHRKTLDALLTALASLPSLQVLNLAGTAFPPRRLTSLLAFSPSLRRLDLSFNALGTADDEQSTAYAVSQLVAVYDRLVRLSLAGCGLRRTAFLRNSSLIEAIEGASSLAAIDLEHNVDIPATLVEQFKTLNVSRHFLKTI